MNCPLLGGYKCIIVPYVVKIHTRNSQIFSGWTSTTLGSNAKTGTDTNPTTGWTGTFTKNIYFKDLRDTGTVTMVANWTPVTVNCPTVTKTGSTCEWYSSSTGGTKVCDSGGSYSPTSTASSSRTLYARCSSNGYSIIGISSIWV